MMSTASLSTKLVRIGAGLLLVALASIGLTLWVTWQLEGGAAAVNETGRMRMQAWRLTSVAQVGSAPDEVASLVQQFDQSLALLRQGDASRSLSVPWDETVARAFTPSMRCGRTSDRYGYKTLRQNRRRRWLQPMLSSRPSTPWCMRSRNSSRATPPSSTSSR